MNYRKWFVGVPTIVVLIIPTVLFDMVHGTAKWWHHEVSNRFVIFLDRRKRGINKKLQRLSKWVRNG